MSEQHLSDVLLVGLDFSTTGDRSTLVIGRKRPNETIDVVNVVQGAYALELYEKLTGKNPREVNFNGSRE